MSITGNDGIININDADLHLTSTGSHIVFSDGTLINTAPPNSDSGNTAYFSNGINAFIITETTANTGFAGNLNPQHAISVAGVTVIDKDGSMGIATTSPSANLHVVGNVYSSGNLHTAGNFLVTGGMSTLEPAQKSIQMGYYTGYPNDMGIELSSGSGGECFIDFSDIADTSNTNFRNRITSTGGQLRLHGAGESVGFTPTMTLNELNVGIGTTSPEKKLDVIGDAQIRYDGASHGTVSLRLNHNALGQGSGGGLLLQSGGSLFAPEAIINTWTSGVSNPSPLLFKIDGTEYMRLNTSGNVGINETSPKARLDIGTGTSTHYVPNTNEVGVYDYYSYSEQYNEYFGVAAPINWSTVQVSAFGLDGTNTGLFGIHSLDNIVTQGTFVSTNGSLTSSDIRIKKDIVDVSDTEALTMVRNLAPKKYRYIDPVMDARSNAEVIGFIAQDVANVIPGSTRTKVETIPNIMAMALVTDSNVLTFSNVAEPFDTSTLLTTSNIITLRTIQNSEVHMNITEILGTHSFRLDGDVTPYMGSIDENGVHIKDEDGNHVGNGVFVYGQMVNDFNVLKKEVVFATGIAALQEVDRQQVADKARIATLESQVADLLTRIAALEAA